MARDSEMDALRAMRNEAIVHPFPLGADLPDEFEDLYFEWVELRDLVLPMADDVVEGRHPDLNRLTQTNLPRIKGRLAALQERHPSIADEFTRPFRYLEALVNVLGGKGS